MARGKRDKWYPFDKAKGSYQALPPVKRMVLVVIACEYDTCGPCVAVGYLKYAAGDKQSPHFIHPGAPATNYRYKVTHWNDCLGDDFKPPCWQMSQ